MGENGRPLNEYSLQELEDLIEKCGSKAEAARQLGVPVTTLKDHFTRLKHGGSSKKEKVSGYEYKNDTYIFWSKSIEGTLEIPGWVWRGIVKDYSNQVGGRNRTRGQISLDYAEYISRQELEHALRLYGMYKVDPPYTRETMTDATAQDWADMEKESLEVRKRKFITRLQQREQKDLLREVMDLREEVWNRDNLLSDLKAVAEDMDIQPAPIDPVNKVIMDSGERMTSQPQFVMSSMADLHSGKHSWKRESYGGDYDINIAVNNILWSAAETVKFVNWADKLGPVERLFLPNVGDHFHALDGQTESGTELEQDTRAFKVWAKTFEADVQKIELLRTLGKPIDWFGSPGNHDHMFFQFYMYTLLQRYREVEDVTIHTTPRWQDAFLVGDTLHVLDHGKGLPENLNTPAAKLAADRIARSAGGDLYFQSRSQVFYTGHLHEFSTASEGEHSKLIRLLPMSPGDEYEAKGRYTGRFGFTLFLLDGETGWPVGSFDRFLQPVMD